MTPPQDKSGRGGGIRRWLCGLSFSMIAGVVILGAVIFYVAAPINIAARTGAYPGIGWVLHTYMKQWARNWSFWVEKPDYADLFDPAMIRLGAGYFETGCAACHGAPGRDRNPLVTMMEPPPPTLASKDVANFSDKELYWIVWNGIRYTAMPGWTGDNREDEVWAMVAFLRNYGKFAPHDYVNLAYGDAHPKGVDGGAMSFGGLDNRLDKIVQSCARCHGEDGMGRDGTAPKIAGQSKEYLTATLEGYATGKRASGFMQPIAAPLSDTQIAALAAYYADKRPDATARKPAGEAADAPDDTTLKVLGERLAAKGDPSRFVPSCNSCHEDKGSVQPRAEYPRIAGQEGRFIEAWLRLYRDRPLGGSDFAEVMHVSATGLTDHQIKALAAWYSSLPYDAGAKDAAQAKSDAAAALPD
ncbi:c-type cytochrome [Aquicoccus sp. G2-2]|uniref:c-type cytochrome n=1 Tax=Aquicoccus sp. G2-2 TaxID=3092120 RepID=UPI002AE04EBA|nr:c-type cytochrome [Aquicoccus sp. G2-2]MEA1115284.1 c-type cytochrome [Aquicoccus sp. G2-2]